MKLIMYKYRFLLLALLAALITLFAYSQFFGLRYMEFDAMTNILSHSNPGTSEVISILTQPLDTYNLFVKSYRPFESFVWWGLIQLVGLDFNAFLTLNFLIHAANAFLVFFLAKRLLSDKKGFFSLFAALFFALNPIHLHTVVFVSRFAEILVAFFLISSLLLLIKFLETKKQAFIALAVIACAFGIFSKETGLLIPFVLFAYVFVFSKAGSLKGSFLKSIRLCALFFVALLLNIAMRLLALGEIGGYNPIMVRDSWSFVIFLFFFYLLFPISSALSSSFSTIRFALRPFMTNIAVTFAVAITFVFSLWRASKTEGSRPVRFLLLWLLIFLVAFIIQGSLAPWYPYSVVIAFAILLAWVFSRGVRFFSSSWFARLGVVAVCLFSISVFVVSPLFVSYSWPWVAGETTQLVLDETLSLAKDLPPRSKILSVNYPIYLNSVEHGSDMLGFLTNDYSAQALVDFYLPKKNLQIFGPNILFLSDHPSKADISFECGNCSCILKSHNSVAQMSISLNPKLDPNPSGRMILSPLMVKGGNGLQIFFQGRIQKNTFLFIFDGKKVHNISLNELCT